MNVFDLVASITLDSSQYERGLGQAQSTANSLGGAIAGGLGKAAQLAGGAIAAASSAVVGFGATSVATGMNFDSAMSQVAATMGKTTAEIQNLRDFAQEMGARTAFSATEAAEALNYMALAGYSSEKSMQMLPNVLNLAAAGAMDLAAASDMVTDAESALGLEGEEVTQMVDQMAKASSTTNTSVAQLGEAMLTIGGTAKNLRGGTVELSQALGLLADNGVKGAEGGIALRNILLNLTPKSEEAANAMERIGLKAYDSEGKLRPLRDIFLELNAGLANMTDQERTNALGAIFNKTDLKSVNALLGTTAERWDEVEESISNAGSVSTVVGDKLSGMVEEMKFNFDRMGGDADAFSKEMLDYLHFEYDLDETKAKAAIDTFLESVNEGVTDVKALEEAVGAAGGAADAMAKTQLDNLNGDITIMKSALEGVQIAVSDKLTPDLRNFVQLGTDGLSRMTDAIKSGDLNSAINIFSDIFTQGLNKIIEGLPKVIDTGIRIIGALAQGIVQSLPTLGNAALQVLEMLGNYITQYAPVLIAQIPTLLSEFASGFKDSLGVVVDIGLDIINAIIQGVADSMPEFAAKAPEIIGDILAALIENIPKLLTAGLEIITTINNGMMDSLPALIQSIPDMFSKVGEAIMKVDWLGLGKALILAVLSGIKENYTLIPTIWLTIGQTAFDNVKNINWYQLGYDVVTFVLNGIKFLFYDIPNKLKEIGTNAVDYFRNLDWSQVGKDTVTFILEGIKFLFYDIPNELRDIGFRAFEEIQNIDWFSLGSNIVDGIIQGVQNLADDLINTVSDMAEGAWDAIKDFFDINSPSKKMMWMGEMIDKGLSKGIEDSADLVSDAMDELNVTPEISTSSFDAKGMALGNSENATSNTSNNVVINVYGAAGQDMNELAEIIEKKINAATRRREGAFA